MQIFWYDDQKNVSNYFENIIKDGSVDQTSLIQNIIDSHIGEEIKVPTGTYLITHLNIPNGTFLKGEFNTIFKSFSDTNVIRILSGVNCLIENIHVLGANEIIRPKISGTQVGWYLDNCLSVTLNNCSASGCNDSGIKIKNTGAQSAPQYYKIPILNNFKAYRNYIGIKNDVRGEYCQLNGCIAGENHIGYFTGGGNNMASNCQFNRNQNGARIVGGVTDGVSYPNNSHASFSGCQFNHNIDESIRFENVEVGYMLNGCQFFDGEIIFKGKTKGVIINGSEGGTWSINSDSKEQNLITNSFFYTSPSGNWATTIIHKNNIGSGAIIEDNSSPSLDQTSLIFKARYDLFKTSNRGVNSWRSGGPHIFWGSKDIVVPPNKYVGYVLIRLENCNTTFEKECFLAAIDASTEICIDILAKNYLPEIINLDGVKYASIPVKKQFSTHIFFVAGVNRGASSSEAGMAYGRISATNNFAYFSDRTPSLEQKITLNTSSINCELVICQDYK
ncbi:hypothetical protein HS141_13460 [Cetobacterium somerae]|uniref:hypothetical protein n=1 Tax=Cetobacterium somerae TaxID=188913 RepID=UPI00211E5105|nr:hypothetical protein [Cetobacterium somerae]MCQ9627934.1 hypothetical protein [Cetobacterium somerae]